MEIWKSIKGYEGLYEINQNGIVKSLERYNSRKQLVKEKILKQRINKQTGYIQIDLTKNNKKKTFRVHRLVAIHFLPNPENKPEVNHEDGNKENNNVGNLKWVTPKENTNHAYKFGLSKGMKGESNPSVKLKEEDVIYIKNNFKSFDKEFGAKALGKKFGVSGNHISGIISGDKWGHLN